MDQDSFRPVFMDAPEALMVARDGVIVDANHEAARLLGAHSPEEIAGREIGQIVPMDCSTSTALRSALARLARGDLRSYDMEISLPGPVFFPVVMRVSGLGGGSVAISLRDATLLRRIESSLQCSVETVAALVETCPMTVFRIDSDNMLVQASPSLSLITGWGPAESRGRKCHEILMSRDSVCAGCPAVLSRLSGAPVTTLIRIKERQWRASAAALGGLHGGAGAVVFIEECSPVSARPSAPSASQEGMAVDAGGTAFDEDCALEVAESGRLEGVFACVSGPSLEDCSSILALVDSELSGRLGRRVRVLPAAERSPVPVSGSRLLDLVRRLEASDFGTCLGREAEIVIRIDRIDPPLIRHGAPESDCLALSMGAAGDLALMSGGEMRSLERQPVQDAAGGKAAEAGWTGAVFVAKSRGGRPFYQILLQTAGRDGSYAG